MLNKLPHPHLIFSQSYYLIQVVDTLHNDKQCRSRSVSFFRSQLIWIYTVCKSGIYPGSAGPGLIYCRKKSFLYSFSLSLLISGSFFILAKTNGCFIIAPARSRVRYRRPIFCPSVHQHLCRRSTFMSKLVF